MDRRTFLSMPAAASLAAQAAQSVPQPSARVTRLVADAARTFHFGAVYFRKSNPPAKDWERDHRVAAEDGHTLFRHWVLWNGVEVAPGKFNWSDYDRQMDLAAKNNIKVILAEMLVDSPEWLINKLPEARVESRSGVKRQNEMHRSCYSGGHHVLCLDHPEVQPAAGNFLSELARRYRGHPALLGYDIWNECTFYVADRLCFCPATQRKFRQWAQSNFPSLPELAHRWGRLSLASWEDVVMARQVGLYADVLDTLRFQLDNAIGWMRWRRDVIRREDPDHIISAHGNARSYSDIVPAAGDDWRAGEVADLFGWTYYFGNNCHPLLAADLIRGASRGKVFWRAEAVGDAEWMNRHPGTPRPEMDKLEEPENIRVDCFYSMVSGARAYQNPRWRPLLDGPLFGAYGWYGMDGSRTERSDEIKLLAQWSASEQVKPLWQANPIRGEVGLLIDENSQAFCYTMQGETTVYSRCIKGAYQAFLDSNVQCDFVRLEDIAPYRLIYIPYPVALSDRAVAALIEWTRSGGCLVGEACPGYFNDAAHAFETQPSRKLNELFGARENKVSFGIDRWENLAIRTERGSVPAGVYRQSFEPQSGKAVGWFEDGSVALVDNAFGQGRARLAGSMPSYAYLRRPTEESRSWFHSHLTFAGVKQHAATGDPLLIPRVWEGESGRFLWIINQSEAERSARVKLAEHHAATRIQSLRGRGELDSGAVAASVPGRDCVIVRLGSATASGVR